VNWVRSVTDASLEIVIAFSRLLAVAAVLTTFVALGQWIWTGDGRWGGLAALDFALAWAAGWFGFWLFGNEEWRRGKADDRGA